MFGWVGLGISLCGRLVLGMCSVWMCGARAKSLQQVNTGHVQCWDEWGLELSLCSRLILGMCSVRMGGARAKSLQQVSTRHVQCLDGWVIDGIRLDSLEPHMLLNISFSFMHHINVLTRGDPARDFPIATY